MARKRRVFEQGHARKLLVVVDESPEVEVALYYAAGRALHAGGRIMLLYVIEPENQFWDGYKGPVTQAAGTINAEYVLVQMCASVASGQATPEEAAREAERRARRYYR